MDEKHSDPTRGAAASSRRPDPARTVERRRWEPVVVLRERRTIVEPRIREPASAPDRAREEARR